MNLHAPNRECQPLEAQILDEEEDLDEARDFVIGELALSEPVDAIAALHHAVWTSNVIVRAAPDGTPFIGLFNTSTVDQSPSLRDYLE